MFDWLTPEASLAGLVAYAFLAATLLPGGSEVALFAYLRASPEQATLAIALVTAANTAGGMTSYLCGRYLPRWQRLESLPQAASARRWGSPALLLAWAPIVGDLLCVAAGWLKLNWLACLLFMTIGKFARYWLVGQGALLAG
jgi:membrane protein YqaA with SNARE-associated domain